MRLFSPPVVEQPITPLHPVARKFNARQYLDLMAPSLSITGLMLDTPTHGDTMTAIIGACGFHNSGDIATSSTGILLGVRMMTNGDNRRSTLVSG